MSSEEARDFSVASPVSRADCTETRFTRCKVVAEDACEGRAALVCTDASGASERFVATVPRC